MGYHLRVKICGVTDAGGLAAAVAAGADAIGLNFHPLSPRSITPQTARALLADLPPFVEPVGVFVGRSVADQRAVLGQLPRILTVQLHGGSYGVEDASPCRRVPAFQVRGREDLEAILAHLEQCRQAGCLPAAVLIDGHAPGLAGGTGQAAPWDLLADFRPGVPVILAGGLTPDNVAEAVRRVRPWAVDVASGVESAPGRKDAELVRRFIDAAREAARSA
jgi:phosphoribosylanthranilate isomerase